jgi:hypothetical protein
MSEGPEQGKGNTPRQQEQTGTGAARDHHLCPPFQSSSSQYRGVGEESSLRHELVSHHDAQLCH